MPFRDRLLRACRREAVDTTPVWLMRQAGRYMPTYRRLRARYAMLALVKTPELALEVTLQPVNAFDLDAAIVFADILPLLEAMGLQINFDEGSGPVIQNPLRTGADVERLIVSDPRESLAFTLEAVRLAAEALRDRLPVIGFSGAPFTLASYAIEGGGSKNYTRTKALMYSDPHRWHSLMEKLAVMVGNYLYAQAESGALVLQMFDSWVGWLSPGDYVQYVLPHSARALGRAAESGVPVIHFATNATGLLPLLREAGGDVIGVDWRAKIDEAWQRLGEGIAIQGNLDPAVLLGPQMEIERHAAAILDAVNGRPGHIFNLGHGILPDTPPENVAYLVDYVHAYGREASREALEARLTE